MELKNSKKAEEYLEFSSGLQGGHGLKLLERMNPLQGDFILDLGCGTGNLSSVIAERVGAEGRVLAIDPDGHRIALARKTFGHIENITFEEGSSDSLPRFGKACFDAVFMNYVLHWIRDKRRAMKNICDSLKPGGRVAMLFNLTLPPLLDKAVRDLNSEENHRRWRGKYFCEAMGQIESYCKEVGLAISESAEMKQCVIHKDLSNYLALASSSTHGVFDLDLVEEQNLKKFKLLFDNKGRLFDEYPTGIVIATKMPGL